MAEAPVVLVLARDQSLVERLVRDLKAEGLVVYGTISLDKAVRSMTAQQPKVLVADPASEECVSLLDRSGGWKSIALVAIAESEETVGKAREMGINNVIKSDDAGAIVKAVLNLLPR